MLFHRLSVLLGLRKPRKTPEETADANMRTASLGLFNQAEGYWLSAVALENAKVGNGFAADPVRSLYHHAIELYLKSFLREHGHTVEELEGKFRHNYKRMGKRAKKLGLKFEPRDEGVLAYFEHTDMLQRARYIKTGYYSLPEIRELDDMCQGLRDKIGNALQARGIKARL